MQARSILGIGAALALLALGGCGGDTRTDAGGGITVTSSGGAASMPAGGSIAPSAGDPAAPPGGGAVPNLAAAGAAARRAAATDPLCATSALGDFYWEIGGAATRTPLVSHAEGGATVTADTRFNIASASKFVFGAYVLQKKGIDAVRADSSLMAGLRFLSGYTGLNETACAGTTTIGACFGAGMGGRTQAPDPDTVGKFDYDGGHDQKLAAVDLGLASATAAQLDAEYRTELGLDPDFNMAPLDPLLAGGMMASASSYARFLQRIMTGQLVLGAHLGEDAVCTLPSACPGQVAYSPIVALGEPWTYSYNHWVESEHGKGTVDAYSSPGKWGFYPWITPDRKYYGIVARHDLHPDAYAASVKCGRQIRKAFLGAL
jgi:hypothetical protein